MATVKRLVTTCDRASCTEETSDRAGWSRFQVLRGRGAQPAPLDLCPTHTEDLAMWLAGDVKPARTKRQRLRPVG